MRSDEPPDVPQDKKPPGNRASRRLPGGFFYVYTAASV